MDVIPSLSNRFLQWPQRKITFQQYTAHVKSCVETAFNSPPDEAIDIYNQLISDTKRIVLIERQDGRLFDHLLDIVWELNFNHPEYDGLVHQFLSVLFETGRLWSSDVVNGKIAGFIFSAMFNRPDTWKVHCFFKMKLYIEVLKSPGFSPAFTNFRWLARVGYIPPLQTDAAIVKDPYSYIYQNHSKHEVFQGVLGDVHDTKFGYPKNIPALGSAIDANTSALQKSFSMQDSFRH